MLRHGGEDGADSEGCFWSGFGPDRKRGDGGAER